MKRQVNGIKSIGLFENTRSQAAEKMREAAVSVLPIVLIVLLLCLFVAPMSPALLLSFLLGAVLITVGMGLFSLGAEQSMTPIGNKIGTALTKTRNLPLILGVSFLLGFASRWRSRICRCWRRRCRTSKAACCSSRWASVSVCSWRCACCAC